MNRITSRDQSTKRNSVNSSLTTVKGSCPLREVNQTVNKFRNPDKRLSFEYLKQNEVNSSIREQHKRKDTNLMSKQFAKTISTQHMCFNHPRKTATHSVLGDSQDPIYCCQRCAVLVATKGFEIDRLKCGDQNVPNMMNLGTKPMDFTSRNGSKRCSHEELQAKEQACKVYLNKSVCSQISECWEETRMKRESTLGQIDLYINSISRQVEQVEEFFYVLHEYIEKEKNKNAKNLLFKKAELQNFRIQTNKVFITQLEAIRGLKMQLQSQGYCHKSAYFQTLNSYRSGKMDVRLDQLGLPEIQQRFSEKECHLLGQKLLKLLGSGSESQAKDNTNTNETSQKETYLHSRQGQHQHQKIERHSKKYDKECIMDSYNAESSVRSLQLSFEESDEEVQQAQISLDKMINQKSSFALDRYIQREEDSSHGTMLLLSSMQN